MAGVQVGHRWDRRPKPGGRAHGTLPGTELTGLDLGPLTFLHRW